MIKRANMRSIFPLTLWVSLFFVTGTFQQLLADTLNTQSNQRGGVTIRVRPVTVAPGNPITFEISMNTHSVDLDYDMTKVCELTVDGKRIKAVEWEGSPPGGHHRSGKLIFQDIEKSPQEIKLVIKGVSGVPERIFTWNP